MAFARICSRGGKGLDRDIFECDPGRGVLPQQGERQRNKPAAFPHASEYAITWHKARYLFRDWFRLKFPARVRDHIGESDRNREAPLDRTPIQIRERRSAARRGFSAFSPAIHGGGSSAHYVGILEASVPQRWSGLDFETHDCLAEREDKIVPHILTPL